jgi:hypothetical protein
LATGAVVLATVCATGATTCDTGAAAFVTACATGAAVLATVCATGAVVLATVCATGATACATGAAACETGAAAFATVPETDVTAGIVVAVALESAPVRLPADAMLIGATIAATSTKSSARQTVASRRTLLPNHGVLDADCKIRPKSPSRGRSTYKKSTD